MTFDTRPQVRRTFLAAVALAGTVVITGCGMMPGNKAAGGAAGAANLVTLSTRLTAASEVPPTASAGTGTVDAVLNKDTNLLRWKASYSGLSGPATAAHFHGPASPGANAGVVLPWPGPVANPLEGSAMLTPAQAADLLAGRWYANVHTAANPGGEVRGQMTVRN